MNGIMQNSLKQNLLYVLAIGGVCYISKSTYDFIFNLFKEKNQFKEIKNLIQKERAKLSNEQIATIQQEFILNLYYKILHTVYKKEIQNFNLKRRELFNIDDIERYLLFVEDYLKDLKLNEESIFRIIYDELKLDFSIDILKADKLDIK